METTVTLSILHHAIAFFIKLSTISKIFIRTLSKIVLIYKVVAGVVWRVDKDAVFDTNRKSLLRHISAEKGLK